jgi:Predicted ribosomal protein
MIEISAKKKDNDINYIKITGHAEYAEEGFDIVCASVSCIAITTVNALISIDEECVVYSEADGLLEIGIVKQDEITIKLVNNMLNLLSNLSEDYKDYIKIKI